MRHRTKKKIGVALRLLAIAASVVVGLLLTSCANRGQTNTYYDDIRRENKKIHRLDHTQRDTIYIHDSVATLVRGDTIRIERWRNRYVERLRVDTIYDFQRDTISLVSRIYVEKNLSRWQSFKLRLFPYLLLLILLLALLAYWFARR